MGECTRAPGLIKNELRLDATDATLLEESCVRFNYASRGDGMRLAAVKEFKVWKNLTQKFIGCGSFGTKLFQLSQFGDPI